jgi:hypothetical protein
MQECKRSAVKASRTSALGGDEWSASRFGHFCPATEPTGTPWIGVCVGSGVDLDVVAKTKILVPAGLEVL